MYQYKSPEYDFIYSISSPITPTIKAPKKAYGDNLIDKVKRYILDWQNLWICGGAALNFVKGYHTNDVDFYVVGCDTLDHFKATVDRLLSYFHEITHKTNYSISGLIAGVKVQLILVNDQNVIDIVDTYDVQCCKVAYTIKDDEEFVLCTRDFISCIKSKTISFSQIFIGRSYHRRLAKYISKGFNLYLEPDYYATIKDLEPSKYGIMYAITKPFEEKTALNKADSNYDESKKEALVPYMVEEVDLDQVYSITSMHMRYADRKCLYVGEWYCKIEQYQYTAKFEDTITKFALIRN